jgi:hypothetical protein
VSVSRAFKTIFLDDYCPKCCNVEMTNPNVITLPTNTALREAAARYSASITVPCYVKEVDGFASANLSDVAEGVSTLVIGTPDSLAVSVHDTEGKTRLFVNIDLEAPGKAVASIVAPGFYNERGERDAEKGKMMRPVVRPLTEVEGRELTMDLYSIIAKIPADRRKS